MVICVVSIKFYMLITANIEKHRTLQEIENHSKHVLAQILTILSNEIIKPKTIFIKSLAMYSV